MTLVIGADAHQGAELYYFMGQIGFGGERFIGVDIDQIDKVAPRRVKSAPCVLELNQHFGAGTDLLNLQCKM